MNWMGVFLAVAVSLPGNWATTALEHSPTVDLELVIAVDISFSVSPGEQDIQRRGYAHAFEDPQVVDAITSGLHGKIAVTYLEWAGVGAQFQIIPWAVIASKKDARALAKQLREAPVHRSGQTSISQALLVANGLFSQNPNRGERRVIDISSDGLNNAGLNVDLVRDSITALDVTINGLPLLAGAGDAGVTVDLDAYYRACVIGGPGAFSFPVRSWEEFGLAVQRKLVREIASRPLPDAATVYPIADETIDCLSGERAERDNYLRQLDDLTNGRSQRWLPREQDWPTPK